MSLIDILFRREIVVNILTFDIEDWFHILDHGSTKTEKEWSNFEYRLDSNMDRIFRLLDKHQQKATFFCLGWVAKEFPHIIKKISDLGYEIATHSNSHQLIYEQSKKEFEVDLDISINRIEDIIGKKVRIYRAPGFSLTQNESWVFEMLIDKGIEVDCSVFPAKRSHGGFEKFVESKPTIIECTNGKLREFPINLYPLMYKKIIFSGGGYFRLLPYQVIEYMMNRSSYVMTYFHPRDFDKYQPMIENLSYIRKFKSYYGLGGALEKLDRLIENFEFYDISEAEANVDWSTTKSIYL